MTAALAPWALAELQAAPGPVGVAVSGGSDSTALLHLCTDALGAGRVVALTVDHRLRPEAADEARAVADAAAALGVAHRILVWEDAPGHGNVAAAAAEARYRLLADAGCAVVALGHTRDDAAESFLMGVSRGAGLDGLCGIRPVFRRDRVRFVRPLLGTGRSELRDWLSARDIGWVDDPSNEDVDRLRVRARGALTGLDAAGFGGAALAASLSHLADSRNTLHALLAGWARAHVRVDRGDLQIDAAAWADLPGDGRRRLMGWAIRWITGAPYPPRAPELSRFAEAGGTLAGTRLIRGPRHLRLTREAALAAPAVPFGRPWDGRWIVEGPAPQGSVVAALSEAGLADCPDWRATGLPRPSLMSGPAVWKDGALVAAPLACPSSDWTARLAPGRDGFPQNRDND